ncbi:MAG: glycosyltransferase family 4 protein [Bacteroidota bacterium]
MHISFASTYPPRACGLATFTRDLRAGVGRPGYTSDVLSLVNSYAGPERLPEVGFEIRQPVQDDYAAAAEYLNASSTDVLCIQHEFGIFGGPEGTYVLELMEATHAPVVTTLHTVLPSPEPPYLAALKAVARRSDRLVVMTLTARELLSDVYGVSASKVDVIPHGTPDGDPSIGVSFRSEHGLENRTVLLTFGLLGPSKGIEFALEALPRAIEASPDALYVILGATHPEIVRTSGEAYRESLKEEIATMGLGHHVRFVDRYVSSEELWAWLSAADLYVSPYPGMDQICSGTLAYALAAGLPVVSTPYLHAREVLAGGAGRLASFGDTDAFGDALAHFVADPAVRMDASTRARSFGATTSWPLTGDAYADVFERVLSDARAAAVAPPSEPVHPAALSAALDALARLTDDVGPFQHATFGRPDRKNGYSTDDAGRAIVVALAAAERHDPRSDERVVALRIARTCLGFLDHAQTEEGGFHNFMDYSRRFADAPAGEDTVGRAMWGLGAAIAWGPDAAFRTHARSLLERSLPRVLHHPRALAYAMCGLELALDRFPGVAAYRTRLREHGDALVARYRDISEPGWAWFNDDVTYANALLPYALLRASKRLEAAEGADALREVALESLAFILEQSFHEGLFDAIGNRGWLRRDGTRAAFDQQPIEAGYAAWVWSETAEILGDPTYADAARRATEWFYGRNRIGEPLFEAATGACYDGFGPKGVNLNQGAESAIAGVFAHLALHDLDATAAGLSAPPATHLASLD